MTGLVFTPRVPIALTWGLSLQNARGEELLGSGQILVIFNDLARLIKSARLIIHPI